MQVKRQKACFRSTNSSLTIANSAACGLAFKCLKRGDEYFLHNTPVLTVLGLVGKGMMGSDLDFLEKALAIRL